LVGIQLLPACIDGTAKRFTRVIRFREWNIGTAGEAGDPHNAHEVFWPKGCVPVYSEESRRPGLVRGWVPIEFSQRFAKKGLSAGPTSVSPCFASHGPPNFPDEPVEAKLTFDDASAIPCGRAGRVNLRRESWILPRVPYPQSRSTTMEAKPNPCCEVGLGRVEALLSNVSMALLK